MTTEPHREGRPRIVVGLLLLFLGVCGLVHIGAGAPADPALWARERRRRRLRRGDAAGHRPDRLGGGARPAAAVVLRPARADRHAGARGARAAAPAGGPGHGRRRVRRVRRRARRRRARDEIRSPSPSRRAAVPRAAGRRRPWSPTPRCRMPARPPTPDRRGRGARAAPPGRPGRRHPARRPRRPVRRRRRAAAAGDARARGRVDLHAPAQRPAAHRPGAEDPQRRQRRHDRGDQRRAGAVQRRRAGHRLHPRPDRHPLRDRARARGQGREDHPAAAQHLLRRRHRQRAAARADPRQVGGRHRGAQHRPGDGPAR